MIRGYEAGLKIAEKYSIPNITVLDPISSLEDEIRTINELCNREKIDVVFFEITERELSDYRGLSSLFKKAAVCFDGVLLNDLSLVVSWATDASELFYPEKYPNTKFLLGYEYVTLPPEFFDNKRIQNRQYNAKPKRILVTMGGADENNFTQKVIDSLVRNKINIDVTIIAGSGYEHLRSLKEKLSASGLNFEVKQSVTNMLDEYLGCDIAIGAGGLTASELVASRTPALLIAAYEHQIGRCKFFQEQGWARYLGFKGFKEEYLVHCINNVSPPTAKPSFDTWKIVDEIEKISKS